VKKVLGRVVLELALQTYLGSRVYCCNTSQTLSRKDYGFSRGAQRECACQRAVVTHLVIRSTFV